MVNVAAVFEDPHERPTHQAWVEGLAGRLQRGPRGAYVGLLGEDANNRRTEAYPGQTGARLAEVKRRYDPTNLFSSFL